MSDVAEEDLATLPVGRLLLRAHRQAQAASLAKLQQRGHADVRPGHIPAIAALDPAGTRITDLAARAGMTRQMMGRLVRELEDLGYVRSRPDPSDQRAVIVSWTELGQRFMADAPAAMADVEHDYAELLGADGLRALREALVRMAKM